jgi:tetratricopeptide (TPR) repeat protein
MLGATADGAEKGSRGGRSGVQTSLRLDKKNSEALVKLGMVQNERGAPDQALQTYLEGSKINPKGDHLITCWRVASTRAREDWDHAKQQYQKALDIQPDNPLASNNLAYVMLQQGGNVDVAFAMAQTARRQLPDNPNSCRHAGLGFLSQARLRHRRLACSKKR